MVDNQLLRQIWTVPTSQRYTIEAFGAAGGKSSAVETSYNGRGGRIQGDFELEEGETIRILVGQNGQVGKNIGNEFGAS